MLERFVEHDFTVFQMWPWLEEARGPDEDVAGPGGTADALPMMYSVVARRPA